MSTTDWAHRVVALARSATDFEGLLRQLLREVDFDARPLRQAIAALEASTDPRGRDRQASVRLQLALNTGLFARPRHRPASEFSAGEAESL